MSAATLYRGGRVYSPADPNATALLTVGDTIGWVGADPADCPTRPEVTVELDGALVAPAFVDAHVHVTDTGMALRTLDVAGVASPQRLLERVAGYAAAQPPGALIFGQGWDDSLWPDPTLPSLPELERAAGGRPMFLSHVSGHSALCTGALTDTVADAAGLPGYGADGLHTAAAYAAAHAAALGQVSRATRDAAQVAALGRAASLGIACVHECGGPSDEDDFRALLARVPGPGLPRVVGYWGELGAVGRARELGAAGAAGDLCADGALGASTAHLSQPYADGGGCGLSYLEPEQVAAHVVDCTAAGLQAGMHAIGDAAIGVVLAGFAAAADRVGLDRLRAARHRLEHVEILDKTLIAGLVEFGLTASVQPAFDAAWGGAGRMYHTRLGLERSLASNPFGSLAAVGVPLAFGSDSPVTPLDPWGSVRAATGHHNPAQRIAVRTAFAAHTRGGWRAGHRDDAGFLAPGAPATLAVWDCPAGLDGGLPQLADDAPAPTCRRTVLDGVTIFAQE